MEWSRDVGQGDWIRACLSPFTSGIATSVVPGGFEAYARVLHPAARSLEDGGEDIVRWSDVAAWSGIELQPGLQFPDIALPEELPTTPRPWDSGPSEGTLHSSYAIALGDVLLRHGGEHRPWWFGVWVGFGWESMEDPIPSAVRAGPTYDLPTREYFLYSGEPSDALAFVRAKQQTANLWWPSDHSWCVATEIDLHWTYVGGSAELIGALVSDPRIEAVAVPPDTSNWQSVPDWLRLRAVEAARQIRRDGETVVETPHGTLRGTLTRDVRREYVLTVHRRSADGASLGSSRSWSGQLPSEESIVRTLCFAMIELLP